MKTILYQPLFINPFTNNSHKEDNVFANATVMQFNNVKE